MFTLVLTGKIETTLSIYYKGNLKHQIGYRSDGPLKNNTSDQEITQELITAGSHNPGINNSNDT